MDRIPLKNTVFKARMKDSKISFNINRTVYTDAGYKRQVALIPGFPKETIVPGVRKKEHALIKELQSFQNMNTVQRYSFEVDKQNHSLLWRFRSNALAMDESIEDVSALNDNMSKSILKLNRSYKDFLKSYLRDGNVFIVPDREISFGRASRIHRGYSRSVLILKQGAGFLLMVPFSAINRVSQPKVDILLDRLSNAATNLSVTACPAIEAWPYKIFSPQVVLCVHAAQIIMERDFLQAALRPKGSVRRELVNAVRERLKKIAF